MKTKFLNEELAQDCYALVKTYDNGIGFKK